MASGTFYKTVGAVRPGTYINFKDTKDYTQSGTENGTEGPGGEDKSPWKPPDFNFGERIEVSIESRIHDHKNPYPVAKEDLPCGEILIKEEN